MFNKELVYFFLLRPAYRVSQSDEKSDQINRFPFVFVLRPTNVGTPHHVYPFDTGGAFSGVFGDKPDPYVRLEDYELLPTLSAAAGHIGWAFGSVDNYFYGSLKLGLVETLQQWESASRSFISIAALASSGHNQPDKRASAIEVAYRHHVPLKGNAILAVLPKQLLESGTATNVELIKKLNDQDIKWKEYDWHPNSKPDDFFDEISNIVFEHFNLRSAS